MENPPKLTFKYGWDERDEAETLMKGCRSDGIVQFEDGSSYSVYFIDPIRLQQDLEEEEELGYPFLAPPGLIVIPKLTLSAMENAIVQLWKQGYFDALKPLPEEETPVSVRLVESIKPPEKEKKFIKIEN